VNVRAESWRPRGSTSKTKIPSLQKRAKARSSPQSNKLLHFRGEVPDPAPSPDGSIKTWANKPNGYLLGSYRIATAPEPNSSRLTSLKSTCFDSPANNVGP
jgi:hypothetical protein